MARQPRAALSMARPTRGARPEGDDLLRAREAMAAEQTGRQPRDNIDVGLDRAIAANRPVRPDDIFPDGNNLYNTRLNDLSTDARFTTEYQLRLLHRMLIRQMPADLIARTMNLTVRRVYALREQLLQQLRKEASSKDFYSYVGWTEGFYNDAIGIAMRIASKDTATDRVKLGAIQVALQAQRDRVAFFDLVGFHDTVKLTPALDQMDAAMDRANKLIEMSESVLGVFEDELEERVPDAVGEGQPTTEEQIFVRGRHRPRPQPVEAEDEYQVRVI